MRTILPLHTPVVVLAALLGACSGADKSDDTGADTDSGADTDLPTDDTATPENGAPTRPGIAITPAAPPPGADFTVVFVTPSTDPDGDTVTYRYAWSENGAARADLTGEGVPGTETALGEVWEVTVTPNDGAVDGPPATASVTIGNSPPSTYGIRFSPTEPVDREDFTLVLDPAPVDPDGDALTVNVTWYEDESLNPIHQDKTTIEGRYVGGGEVFRAIVSVTDGFHAPVVVEGSVTVANNLPEIRAVRIEPESPSDDDDITVTASATDPDGSPVTLSYTWYRDGVEATDVGNTDTVPASATEVDQSWYAVVSASDGSDTVTETTDTLTVIPWDGWRYTRAFTARISPDGTRGTATWAYDMVTFGRMGENDCALSYTVELAENDRACPDCEFSFSARYTYDEASSTVTTGDRCAGFAADGSGQMAYGGRRDALSLNFHDARYYSYESLHVKSIGTHSYTGRGGYYYDSYDLSRSTDTAGYTTVSAYHLEKRYYY